MPVSEYVQDDLRTSDMSEYVQDDLRTNDAILFTVNELETLSYSENNLIITRR